MTRFREDYGTKETARKHKAGGKDSRAEVKTVRVMKGDNLKTKSQERNKGEEEHYENKFLSQLVMCCKKLYTILPNQFSPNRHLTKPLTLNGKNEVIKLKQKTLRISYPATDRMHNNCHLPP